MSKETRNDSGRDPESDQRDASVAVSSCHAKNMSKQKKSIWSEDLRPGLQQVNTTEIYGGKSIHDVNNNTNTGGIFILRRDKLNRKRRSSKKIVTSLKRFTAYSPL